MKFDYVVMNPPYERNLHLKFLEKVIKVADKTVNISPVRWLQDPFARYLPSTDLAKFEDSVAKHIESLRIYKGEKASNFFKAGFVMDIGIYVCSDKGGYDYSHSNPLINKVVEKTILQSWAPYSYDKQSKKSQKKYVLNVSGIHSASSKYPLMNQTYEKQLEVKEPNPKSHNANNCGLFSFDTDEERRIFYECYNTPFMRWHCSLWKIDVNSNTRKIPYFGDYTKPWTNARFCEYFGITGFISDTEAEPGSEWETILETMKKYA